MGTTYCTLAERSFVASSDIGANIMVKLHTTENQVAVCGLAAQPIGVTLTSVVSGEHVAVRLLNCQGTMKCTAAAAVALNAKVYAVASGYVDDDSSSSAVAVGYAMKAATATSDIIEVLPIGVT
jgi:hypothetical protein